MAKRSVSPTVGWTAVCLPRRASPKLAVMPRQRTRKVRALLEQTREPQTQKQDGSAMLLVRPPGMAHPRLVL